MSKDRLVNELDGMFRMLMKEAYPDTIPEAEPEEGVLKVGFVDKLRLFDSGVRWVQVKNRVDPTEEIGDFERARQQLTGGTRRSRAAGASPRNGADH